MKELVGERLRCGKRRMALLRESRREAVTAQTATSSSTISMGCGSVERYLVMFVTSVVPLRETVITSVCGCWRVGSENGFGFGTKLCAVDRFGSEFDAGFEVPFPFEI